MATCSGEEAAEFAEKILVLRKGNLAAFGTPKEVFADKELRASCMIDLPQVSEFANCMEGLMSPLPRFPVNPDEAAEAVFSWYRVTHE